MIKCLILTSFFSMAFGIEYLDKKGDLNSRSEQIIWPEKFDPEKSKFFVDNEIEIAAPPEAVWKILIDAMDWEIWYVGAKNISFVNPGEAEIIYLLYGILSFNFRNIRLQIGFFKITLIF